MVLNSQRFIELLKTVPIFYLCVCVCVCVCTTLQVCLISLSLLISNELLKSQLKMNTSASVTLIRYKRYVVFIKRKQQRPSN